MIGHLSRFGILLNMCCVKCGVWVAMEKTRFVEFDGMPHTCIGKPYGKKAEFVLEIQE